MRASQPTSCVFDGIISGQLLAHLVLDEEHIVAFLDSRPLFPGHVLVVPRLHVKTLAELPECSLGPLMSTVRQVATAQRSCLGATGTFIALNDEVSQSIPHVHFHVVPRRHGDGLRGFFWPRQRYDSEEQAAEVAALLRKELAVRGG